MERAMDAEGTQVFLKQIDKLWLRPAIEARQRSGELPDDFAPCRVQIIFHNGRPAEVRLDTEVRMRVSASITRPHAVGDQVSLDDLDALHSIELTDLDPNAGHITIVLYRDRWYLAFDFRYHATSSREHLAAARDFLETAADALEKGRLRVMIEDLYAATELMAKAELMPHDQTIATGRDEAVQLLPNQHSHRRDRYTHWAELGNTERQHAELLIHLTRLRRQARYLEDGTLPTPRKAREMLGTAQKMYARLDARLPHRNVL
jgi:hypothetical protein